MEVINALKSRRSCKKFKPDMVPQELLDQIMEAGTYAPTGRNLQSPIILCVTNREVRDRLSALNAQVMGAPVDPFYGAPVILVVLAKKAVTTHVCDGSLVLGNMLLAAQELGLGACWIHRCKESFETEEGKAILAGLGLDPEEYEGVGNCIVGYPDAPAPAAGPRKENYIYYIR